MAFVNANYSSFRSLFLREDSDGKIWARVQTHASLTAKTPYAVFVRYDGYRTSGFLDSGLASVTSPAAHQFYFGVPDEALTSDTAGWVQIGGYVSSVTLASTTVTQGNYVYLTDTSVYGSQEAGASWTGKTWHMAVGYTSASSTATHDLFLVTKLNTGLT